MTAPTPPTGYSWGELNVFFKNLAAEADAASLKEKYMAARVPPALQDYLDFYLSHDAGEWYVDTVNGSDSNDGMTWATAFATMAKAFTVVASHETIYFKGTIREQLVAPETDVNGVPCSGVSIIGAAGGHVRDDQAAKWTYPASGAVAGKALLEMPTGDGVGWMFNNFLMTPEPTSGACLQFDDGTGHFICDRMRFVGIDVTTTYGIRALGTGFNRIQNCQFLLLTTGIYGTVAGSGNNWWHVVDNEFDQNTNHIIMSSTYGKFQRNVLHQAGTQNMNVADTAGGTNIVTDNVFPAAAAALLNTGGYKGATGDVWSANRCTDALAYGIPAAGP